MFLNSSMFYSAKSKEKKKLPKDERVKQISKDFLLITRRHHLFSVSSLCCAHRDHHGQHTVNSAWLFPSESQLLFFLCFLEDSLITSVRKLFIAVTSFYWALQTVERNHYISYYKTKQNPENGFFQGCFYF